MTLILTVIYTPLTQTWWSMFIDLEFVFIYVWVWQPWPVGKGLWYNHNNYEAWQNIKKEYILYLLHLAIQHLYVVLLERVTRTKGFFGSRKDVVGTVRTCFSYLNVYQQLLFQQSISRGPVWDLNPESSYPQQESCQDTKFSDLVSVHIVCAFLKIEQS